MPDKNYSVDDILREIRAKQQGEESPAPKPASPAMSREEKELLSRALEHNKNHTYSREERAPAAYRASAPADLPRLAALFAERCGE